MRNVKKKDMIIKPEKYFDLAINQYHLLENNENGLSKAFAYAMSKMSDVFFRFLHYTRSLN